MHVYEGLLFYFYDSYLYSSSVVTNPVGRQHKEHCIAAMFFVLFKGLKVLYKQGKECKGPQITLRDRLF